jgi:2-polyprenyl-3-methyl-5-hydroxy-6-metoxy-1,4-benzoquinol methylase
MSATERFDQAAGSWDLVDRRVVLAMAVAATIQKKVTLRNNQSVLDFGCGTGLVTLELAPLVGSITGADTSTGMLQALEGKAKSRGIPVSLIQLDPEVGNSLGGPYDLITSSMTLHHIEDVPALFLRFAAHLCPGGRVALADLDEEDGSFHEDPTGVHHAGFSRGDIRAWLERAGFVDIEFHTATTTEKGAKNYSVFLAIGSVPSGK